MCARVLQVDCHSAGGYIADDELFQRLVVPLPEGCELTVFMDCCHAGTDYTCIGLYVLLQACATTHCTLCA
jgi:hypothetical protein